LSELKDLVSIHLFFAFVVPGVIAVYVRAQFLTGRIPSVKDNVFEIIVLSSVYYSVVVVAVQPILDYLPGGHIYHDAAWVMLTIVGPIIFGFVLGIAAQRHWLARMASRLNLSMIHVIPTAWDWHFSRIRGDCYVLITLKDGGSVAGYFGTDSFASSDGGERDLYVQEELDWTEEQGWKERQEKVGILIPAREIKYVEFWT
jgi:hypothetical protein